MVAMIDYIKKVDKMKASDILLKFNQFIKFGIVGISNTLVSFMVYYILIYFNIHYIIANTLGFIVSVLNAYYWNARYVFKRQINRRIVDVLMKVYAAYGMTFLLNTGMLIILIGHLHVSKFVAPLINLAIITPINFLLNKYWAFK
jgi:putative flippase GtrA